MIYFDFCGCVGSAWESMEMFLRRGVVGKGTWLGVTCSKRNPAGGSFEKKVEELLANMDAALSEMDIYFPCWLDMETLEFYHYAGGEQANSAMCTFFVQVEATEEAAEKEEEEVEAEREREAEAIGFYRVSRHFMM